MKDEIWKLIATHNTSELSDEQRAAIKAEIEADSAALMEECRLRKLQREAERKRKS